jgi:hypothetical protein
MYQVNVNQNYNRTYEIDQDIIEQWWFEAVDAKTEPPKELSRDELLQVIKYICDQGFQDNYAIDLHVDQPEIVYAQKLIY